MTRDGCDGRWATQGGTGMPACGACLWARDEQQFWGCGSLLALFLLSLMRECRRAIVWPVKTGTAEVFRR